MRSNYYTGFLFLIFSLLIFSCSRDDKPFVVAPNGTSGTIYSSDGSGDGDRVDTDTDVEEGKGLRIDESEISRSYSSMEQKDTVLVEGNVDYEASSNVSWIQVDEKFDSGSDLFFQLLENSSANDRDGIITVSSEFLEYPIEIHIQQSGIDGAFILVDKEEVFLSPSETSFEIVVESNLDYEMDLPEWITIGETLVPEDGKTEYLLETGASDVSRVGQIRILGGDSEKEIVVRQVGTQLQNFDLPVASLFDLSFTSEGVKDYSPFQFNLKSGSELGVKDPLVHFDESLKMYVASFNKDDETLYRLDYADVSEFIDGFKNSFTMEVYFKPAVQNEGESTIIGGMEGNGLGIQHYYPNQPTVLWFKTTDFMGDWESIEGKNYELGIFDHLTFTYDGGTMKSYVNGSIGETKNITGEIPLPDERAQWFGIGGDATLVRAAADYFSGEIAFARFYHEAKDAAEVQNMYEQISDRENLTKVSDLKNVLEDVLPGLSTEADGDGADFLKAVGWKLMNNLSTTDGDIQLFLEEINNLL